MEVIWFVQEMLQNVAEYVVSYRIGQSALRQVDRVLWTIEKCARWAVPPPIDQDERPQPELIRPLPWVLFLPMLIAIRITRESISLVNLVLGKPPLRSTDVVIYIQSKRRYLRTLKYQGNRLMRARATPAQPSQSWFSSLQSLFKFSMCFRRHTDTYGNNNTTRISNNEEVLVEKRNKRGRMTTSPVASTSDNTMERLIEKIMVDLQADSDDDSSYTITNPLNGKSDQSEDGSQQELKNDQQKESTPNKSVASDDTSFVNDESQMSTPPPENDIDKINHNAECEEEKKDDNPTDKPPVNTEDNEVQNIRFEETEITRIETITVATLLETEDSASSSNDHKLHTNAFLQSESSGTQPNNKSQRSSKRKPGITNGRTIRSSSKKGKESLAELTQSKA